MKISTDIMNAMRERIAPLDTNETRQVYREGRFPRADKTKDLDMRYRWDLFYASKCGELVQANASAIVRNGDVITHAHIDTALRRIVPSLA